jgi:hypothetical protein
MFSGFTKLISDELTQFDINSLTSFDDLQNTLDPALAAPENEAAAARKAGRNSEAEETVATETNGLSNHKEALKPSLKGSAESAHADFGRGQSASATAPRLAALPKAAPRATKGSSGSSGAGFFSSFAAPTTLIGVLPATTAVAEAGGDAALVRLLRRELEEAKELASSEGEQRQVFQQMVRGSAQAQVRYRGSNKRKAVDRLSSASGSSVVLSHRVPDRARPRPRPLS